MQHCSAAHHVRYQSFASQGFGFSLRWNTWTKMFHFCRPPISPLHHYHEWLTKCPAQADICSVMVIRMYWAAPVALISADFVGPASISKPPNTWRLHPPLDLPSRTNPGTVHINTTLSSHHSHFKPLKKALTEWSETSANISQTLGIHPKLDTVNIWRVFENRPRFFFFLCQVPQFRNSTTL
jgi:hypothetical protein